MIAPLVTPEFILAWMQSQSPQKAVNPAQPSNVSLVPPIIPLQQGGQQAPNAQPQPPSAFDAFRAQVEEQAKAYDEEAKNYRRKADELERQAKEQERQSEALNQQAQAQKAPTPRTGWGLQDIGKMLLLSALVGGTPEGPNFIRGLLGGYMGRVNEYNQGQYDEYELKKKEMLRQAQEAYQRAQSLRDQLGLYEKQAAGAKAQYTSLITDLGKMALDREKAGQIPVRGLGSVNSSLTRTRLSLMDPNKPLTGEAFDSAIVGYNDAVATANEAYGKEVFTPISPEEASRLKAWNEQQASKLERQRNFPVVYKQAMSMLSSDDPHERMVGAKTAIGLMGTIESTFGDSPESEKALDELKGAIMNLAMQESPAFVISQLKAQFLKSTLNDRISQEMLKVIDMRNSVSNAGKQAKAKGRAPSSDSDFMKKVSRLATMANKLQLLENGGGILGAQPNAQQRAVAGALRVAIQREAQQLGIAIDPDTGKASPIAQPQAQQKSPPPMFVPDDKKPIVVGKPPANTPKKPAPKDQKRPPARAPSDNPLLNIFNQPKAQSQNPHLLNTNNILK